MPPSDVPRTLLPSSRELVLEELVDEAGGAGCAVGFDWVVADFVGELFEHGFGEGVWVELVVLEAKPGVVAGQSGADVVILLEAFAQRDVNERHPGGVSSIVVVSPPWTMARSAAVSQRNSRST